jgi:hypothetical protein
VDAWTTGVKLVGGLKPHRRRNHKRHQNDSDRGDDRAFESIGLAEKNRQAIDSTWWIPLILQNSSAVDPPPRVA